jgi:hypothetical protein
VLQLSTSGRSRFRALVFITLAAALMRLLPHPYNFTPVAGMALFGGAHFRDVRVALAVPLLAMFASDLVLAGTIYDFSALRSMPLVYLAFALTVVLGRLLGPRSSALRVGSASVGAAALFYLITNFGVWSRGTLYPMTWEGLVACYVAAIPFLRNAILGNCFYAIVFFGGFRVAQRRFAGLRDDHSLRVGEANP